MAARKRSGGRTPLTRERILRAAIEFADVNGIQALSMRKLADQLGFEVMSLYNHVINKADILSGVVDLVMVDVQPPGDMPWRAAVHGLIGEAHRALEQHPWLTRLWYTTGSGPARLRYMETLLEILRTGGGFSAELTSHGFRAINRHLLGFAAEELEVQVDDDDLAVAGFLEQISEGKYPRLVEQANHRIANLADNRDFFIGLDLILDGLEQAGAREAAPGQDRG